MPNLYDANNLTYCIFAQFQILITMVRIKRDMAHLIFGVNIIRNSIVCTVYTLLRVCADIHNNTIH